MNEQVTSVPRRIKRGGRRILGLALGAMTVVAAGTARADDNWKNPEVEEVPHCKGMHDGSGD